MDLQGDSKGLGLGMKAGIEAAFAEQKLQGRRIEFVAANDFYNPQTSVQAAKTLLDQGVFAMLGNVGTPTAKAVLPVLKEHHVPAIGFFTGAGLLRPGEGDVINFRASYVQETGKVIEAAMQAGIEPAQVCAYVQNDAYGMAGVAGVKAALAKHSGTGKIVETLDRIQAMADEDPARNNVGPVGLYQRNTLRSREGYLSLKGWEERNATRCRLVITVGTYKAIGNFVAYSRHKGENWLVSAVSFTGADNFRAALKDYGFTDRVIMTQVVPALDSNLPIVAEARKALGDQLSFVSLEGYIAGRMFLAIAGSVKEDITRASFVAAARGKRFDLGGLPLDFSDDNQGSDLVQLTYIDGDQYRELDPEGLRRLLQ
jgi:ABC-type branched-subunit amino acid transport system substrate-binding protein